jgi:hypothetical protein
MAEKIYVGVNSKNIFNGKRTTSGTHIGVTYSYDKENQEYTLNGTATGRGDLLLESGLPIDWEIGEYYTVTIIQTGGTAVIGDGEGITYSFSIFSMNNTKYIRDGNLSAMDFPGTRSFTAKAFEEVGGAGYKFYLQLWRVGTVFDNYKFKVQIEKGSQVTDYEPYFRNVAKEAKKIYFSKEGVARLAEKAYTSLNGIARLVYSIKENSGVVPGSAIALLHLDNNYINEINGTAASTSAGNYIEGKFGYGVGKPSSSNSIVFNNTITNNLPTYKELAEGTKQLTAECWFKGNQQVSSSASSNIIFRIGTGARDSVRWYYDKFRFNGVDIKVEADSPYNNWVHIAYVVKNGMASLFINGKKVASAEFKTDTSALSVSFGSMYGGQFDEILIATEALYTDNFTPLDKPYVVE